MEGGRGRGYGRGGMSRGRGGRGPYRERGGRGGSMRGMGGAPPSYMGDRDRGIGLGSDSGPFGQMDTWNPSGDDMNGKTKSSSKDAFDNAGKNFLSFDVNKLKKPNLEDPHTINADPQHWTQL